MRMLDSHRKANGKVVVDWEDEDSSEPESPLPYEDNSCSRPQLLQHG